LIAASQQPKAAFRRAKNHGSYGLQARIDLKCTIRQGAETAVQGTGNPCPAAHTCYARPRSGNTRFAAAGRTVNPQEDRMTDFTNANAAAGTTHNSPRGLDVLRDPVLNKGSAFTEKERDALGLRGLLPPHVHSQQEQVERVLLNLRKLAEPLDKFVALNALHDRNESLFFRVLCDHIDEMQPLVYTPTVGLACQKFGQIFQRPRGMFIGINDRGNVANILRNWPYRAGIIVVTDGERILGLGDLGANGMGIPVGKLSLYTACAGIHPRLCLPVTLDVGTNNEALRNDPYYVGLRQPRITGAAYDEFVEEFITAAQEVFPGVLIQFEDFANHNAFRLLEKYRNRVCSFNDDIQGTAAVALAGIFSALRVTGEKLTDQKILFLGAGEAATGIADLIVSAMMAQGLSKAEALRTCWLVDSQGLVVRQRAGLAEHKLTYAHDHPQIGDFLSAIKTLKPTAIIGVAAVGGTFTREVLEEMARINRQPIVFALSNPTSQAECTAEEAYRWTGGRALFACGSPFDPVHFEGRTLVPRQGNNSYIFPGVGLGAIACGAKSITDDMFMSAAHTLAHLVTESDLQQGSLYPALPRIREVSANIAAAIAQTAYKQGLAGKPQPSDVPQDVKAQMFDPHY
jgi:malate dehydrogenase (oxaloacetate-decarboxylating)(NADP+)